jgi:hypothetical protein
MRTLFVLFLAFAALAFTGCEKEDPDPCMEKTCLNGGICDDGRCDCPTNYSGDECQIFTNPDRCATITCFNGGTCVNGSCVCPNGWTGSSCQTQVAPTRMEIIRIEVTRFPVTKSDGSVWDNALGNGTFPDVLVSLNMGRSGNQNTYVTEEIDNCDGGTVLEYFGSSNNMPFDITNLSSEWTISLWDDDVPAQDQYMGGIIFTPMDKATDFPSSFVVSTSNHSFTVFVDWFI